MGLKADTVSPGELLRVNVDTTVQETAVRFPTDAQPCHKAREELVADSEVKPAGIPI